MQMALAEAQQALSVGEVPVGCVIVQGRELIAKAHNQVEQLKDATAHAELLALTAAMHALQAKYLPECTVYVTLEPCPMCAYAMHLAQVKRVVWGAPDPKRGFRQWGNLLHPRTQIKEGIFREECSRLLRTFFQRLRT